MTCNKSASNPENWFTCLCHVNPPTPAGSKGDGAREKDLAPTPTTGQRSAFAIRKARSPRKTCLTAASDH